MRHLTSTSCIGTSDQSHAVQSQAVRKLRGRKQRRTEGDPERMLGLRLEGMTIEGQVNKFINPSIRDISVDCSWLALQLHTSLEAG